MNQLPKFDERFQRYFAAYLLRDTQLLRQTRQWLEQEHFTNEIVKALVYCCCMFYDKFASAPDQMIFGFLLDCKDNKKLSDTMHDLLADLCRELLSEPLQNREYLLGSYDKAIKHLSFEASLPKIVDKLKNGSFEDARLLFNETLNKSPKGVYEMGTFYTLDPSERVAARKEADKKKFFTLIPQLDDRYCWIRPGELGMMQGQRSGIGKSAAFVQFARNMVFQGLRVGIYTMELSESDYCDRLDMCVAGLTSDELDNVSKLRDALLKKIRNDNQLFVKQFPNYTTTVNDLREHLSELRTVRGFYPHVIFVDYDDLLDAGDRDTRTNLYLKGALIYGQLRNWAVEDQIAIWVAAQSNREASKESKATESHTAGSRAKIDTVDMAISINQTPQQIINGTRGVSILKMRRSPIHSDVEIPTDLNRMQFFDLGRKFKERGNV